MHYFAGVGDQVSLVSLGPEAAVWGRSVIAWDRLLKVHFAVKVRGMETNVTDRISIYNAPKIGEQAIAAARAGNLDLARQLAHEAAEAYRVEADAKLAEGRRIVDEVNELLESRRLSDELPLTGFGGSR